MELCLVTHLALNLSVPSLSKSYVSLLYRHEGTVGGREDAWLQLVVGSAIDTAGVAKAILVCEMGGIAVILTCIETDLWSSSHSRLTCSTVLQLTTSTENS